MDLHGGDSRIKGRGKLGSRVPQQNPNLPPEYGAYDNQSGSRGPPVAQPPTSYPEYQHQGYQVPQQPYGIPSQGYPMPPGNQPPGYPSHMLQEMSSPAQQPFMGMPSNILQNPMVADAAKNYGQAMLGQGMEFVDQKIEQYVSVSQLKYYFAVDTAYVLKKLGLLLFPFAHKDWSLKYNQDEPVQPRHEVNAPDLYIPTMAFVTYILVSGLALGIQQRFSPEHLGIQASSALIWLIIEIGVISLTIYICNIKTQLNTYHLLAICSYKFVGMIAALISSIVFSSTGYYSVFLYSSASLAFFIVRSLKLLVLKEGHDVSYQGGRKRSMYLLLLIGALQPIMMFWLTWRIATFEAVTAPSNGLR